MTTVFMSYSHADEAMRDRLEKHLAMLKREGVVDVWHDRRIVPGQPLDPTIMGQVDMADVFLFLVSVDFLDSHYCYDVEMKRALVRYAAGEADVIPVILHSCEWQKSPLGGILGLPTDGKPIAKAPYVEDAYLEVARGVRRAIEARKSSKIIEARPSSVGMEIISSGSGRTIAGAPSHPRTSNLAVRKIITEADRHSFLEDGFEFMAKFFEESLAELGRRNPDVEAKFRRNSADVFTARAFRGGKLEAQCKIQLGGIMSDNSVSFSYDASSPSNSSNEMLSVKADDQGLMFDALGMSSMSCNGPGKGLSTQGAAEFLWNLFIKSMQDSRGW